MGLTGLRQGLVVFAQPPPAVEPTESALYNPTAWKNLKAYPIVATLDDLQRPTTHPLHPFDQFTAIPPVGPDQAQALEKGLG